jgi:hypothetical protein
MAKKIIKQGTKEFHMTCPYCGCEFTYENEDVCNSEVICPCCLTNLPHKGVIGKVDECPLPTNGEYGTAINPNGTSPVPIWYNQQVAPDGYKIRDGLNKPLPSRLTTSDNWGSCEGCPNNPKYLKTPYIGDGPCQWCQKNLWKVTCITNLK